MSKQYTNMCDCPEIQNGWKPKRNDNYILGSARPGDKHFAVITLGCCWEKCEGCNVEVNMLRDECIWLPRQDQLQDMVEGHTAWNLSNLFVAWTNHTDAYKHIDIMNEFSMEQLWLAFVMWELHKKKWDGDKWIK